jgi:hypothetical protein
MSKERDISLELKDYFYIGTYIYIKSALPFPAFKMNGTSAQRSLSTNNTVAANVGVCEPLGTVSSSK